MPLGADHPLLGQDYKGSIVKGLKEKKEKQTPDGKVRYYLEIHTVDGNVYKEYDWLQFEAPPKGKASDGLDEVIVISPKRKKETINNGHLPTIGVPLNGKSGPESKTNTPEKQAKKKIVVKGFIKGQLEKERQKKSSGVEKEQLSALPLTSDAEKRASDQSATPPIAARNFKSPEQAPSRNVSVGDAKPLARKGETPLIAMDQLQEEHDNDDEHDDNDEVEGLKKIPKQQKEEKSEKEARIVAAEEAKRRIEEDAARLEEERRFEAEREAKRKVEEKRRKKEEKKRQEAEAAEQLRREEEEKIQRQQETAAATAAAEEETQRRALDERKEADRQRKAEDKTGNTKEVACSSSQAKEAERHLKAAEKEAMPLRPEEEALVLTEASSQAEAADAQDIEKSEAAVLDNEQPIKKEKSKKLRDKKKAKSASNVIEEFEADKTKSKKEKKKAKSAASIIDNTKFSKVEKSKEEKKKKKALEKSGSNSETPKKEKKDKKRAKSKERIKEGTKYDKIGLPPPPLEYPSTPVKTKSMKERHKRAAKEPPPMIETSKGKLVQNKITIDPHPPLDVLEERPGVAKIMGIWGSNYCKDAFPLSPLRSSRNKGGEQPPKLRNIAGEKWELDPNFEPPVFEKTEEEKKRICQSFETNFAFSDLTPSEVEPMVDAFEKVEYEKGEVIAEEGTPDSFFYVVQEGKVSFDMDGELVCEGEVGDAFGEMSLVYSCDRATTVKSQDRRTALLRLDKTSYRHIRRNHVARSVSARMKLLKDVPFFKDADEQDLAQLSTAMVPHVFEANDNLTSAFKEMPFCLIQEGSVSTSSAGNVGPGASFGEEGLEDKGQVGTIVTAVTDGVAYTIDRPSFEKVFGDMGQLAQKSSDKKILRDLRAIRAAKVDGPVLDLLARQIADEPFREGEKFCVMNEDMVPKLYIVRVGSVKVVRKNGKEDIIQAGGFFGHEYLMTTSKGGRDSVPSYVKAKYSATALEDGVCGILTLQECVSVFGSDTSKNEDLEDGQIIPLEDLEHYRVLGEGHFGVVWLVASKKASKPEPYALKIQMLADDERNAEECIKEEIAMMRKLQYPFIVRVINTYDAEETISMLLGLAPGGELFDQIHYQLPNGLWDSGIGEEKGRFYSSVVADALAFMHIRGFIYRDLKPENVLIDKDGYPLITDFGFTRQLKKDELAYTMCGTPNYLPPEIIKNLGHGAPADNWSLAVLIYEVVQGESPFWYEGLDQVSLFHAICEEDYYPLPEEGVSEELRDLIHRLLEKNPSKRLGTFREKDILKHPWFAPLDIKKIRKKEIKAPWVPDPVELGEPFKDED
ncbi:serine/threonine protein kinase [Nitzschia inconspicua]|uniref:Serine/threonine protein kinase n=1 Tax=Nitzschia inconspicua TaxID=303405 RepID=A0A9K3L3S3_9STRA|nr:serine/threonine protein kinase [Nitzschia inconspicua]